MDCAAEYDRRVIRRVYGGVSIIILRGGEMLNHSQRGQGLAEYALILALIAILAVAALTFLSGAINGLLSQVGATV
jgi:Flp pilus assembly pilin Flp